MVLCACVISSSALAADLCAVCARRIKVAAAQGASDLTRTLSTMKISRVDSPVVYLLLVACRCCLAADLTLQHSYPSPGNFNLVRLSCGEQFGTPVAGATFHLSRGGTEEEEEIEGKAVPGSPGAVLVTLSQQTEGDLRCRHGSETSQPLALAGLHTHTHTHTHTHSVAAVIRGSMYQKHLSRIY